jgi:hypothetical protein
MRQKRLNFNFILERSIRLNKENCIFIMEEYFSLCIKAGTIMQQNRPSFDDNTDYHQESHWMKFTSIDDLMKIFEISPLKLAYPNLTTFFK